MINLSYDNNQITKLQTKFAKYGPYAITSGLRVSNTMLNEPSFLMSMYPPSRSGQPFIWSSDRQRRFVFANIQLPSVRTYALALAGRFEVNEKSFWIEYQNFMEYAKWVLHPTTMIIGHRTRGWKPVTDFVKKRSGEIVSTFKQAAINAWTEMDNFMFGGGAGL